MNAHLSPTLVGELYWFGTDLDDMHNTKDEKKRTHCVGFKLGVLSFSFYSHNHSFIGRCCRGMLCACFAYFFFESVLESQSSPS